MEQTLSKLRRWELDHEEQDIRGWPLRDEAGRIQGTVSELLFDSDTKQVTHVVLADGRRYRARDVWLGDQFVALTKDRRELSEASAVSAPAVTARTATAAGLGTAAASSEPLGKEPLGKAAFKKEPLTEKAASNGDLILPIIDEEIEIEKRAFDAGGVRVETHLVKEPVTKDVRLEEERVTIQRKAVDRPLDAAEADKELRDKTVEMTAKAEVPVVSKRAHVSEEVVIKKDRKDRVEHVRDSLRHTEVEITQLSASKHLEGK